MAPSQVVLVGARDIDPAEAVLLEQSAVPRRGLDLAVTEVPSGDLLLHVDVDICDPTAVPDLLFPAPGGPGPKAVAATVRRIMGTGRVVAVDLAPTWHHNGPAAAAQRRAMRHLKDAVADPTPSPPGI